MTMGSLFTGIGGLDLGLEWAGLGPTLWQVEKDAFCRRKLAWRWPDATRFEDVRDVGAATLVPVDLICGGFPCQDVSSAGKRAGLAGARSGLWYEFARVVGEMRPRWVVVENVASGANKWVDAVRGELERLGYATLPVPVAASDCGAPHERARVFIVACRPSNADHSLGEQQGSDIADAHGAELRKPGRRSRAGAEAAIAAQLGPDAVRFGCDERPELSETRTHAESTRHAADAHDHTRGVHAQSRQDVRDAQRHGGWATEPAVARVVHGFPGRVDYERALGNSVVPQCAEVVGHVIRQLESA